MRVKPLMVLGCAGWLTVMGCGKILGLDDYRVAPKAPQAEAGPYRIDAECGGFGFTTAECTACIGNACCPEGRACANDPTCQLFVSCDGKCNPDDEKCLGQCATGVIGMRESEAVADFVSCRASNCS